MKATAHVKLDDGQAFETECELREHKYTHSVRMVGLSLQTIPPVKEILIRVHPQEMQS